MGENYKNRCCIALGCLNSKKYDRGLSFFSLPTDSERRKLWLTILGREDLIKREGLKPKSHFVCDAHFDDSEIKIQKQLKTGSVPKHLELDTSGTSMQETNSQLKPAFIHPIAASTDRTHAPVGAKDLARVAAEVPVHADEDLAATSAVPRIKRILSTQCDDTQAGVLQEVAVEVKQEQDELSRVCRVCLRYCSDTEEMTPLLRGDELTEAGSALTAFCSQVKINANENLPMQMCDGCTREAIRAERFYRRVKEAHARLATLAPHDIVQFSHSLEQYFPERCVSDKLGADDETAFISLRYDGDQHLELSFDDEPSTAYEVEAATEKRKSEIPDDENIRRKIRKTDDTQDILLKTLKRKTKNTCGPNNDVRCDAFIVGVKQEDTQQLQGMEDVFVKEEPLVDTSETVLLTHTDALDETRFRCSECDTEFLTRLEAERHVVSAHGPVPAYVWQKLVKLSPPSDYCGKICTETAE